MANVRFYRLDALPAYNAEKHQGVFVHLTVTENEHQTGLWFGGSQDWEYLTNDPNAVTDDLLDKDLTPTVSIGYLKQGDKIDKGTSIEELLRTILVKVLKPKIGNSPTAKINPYASKSTVFVGDEIIFPGATMITDNGKYISIDRDTGTDFSKFVSQQPLTGVFFNHETITTTQTNSNYDTSLNVGSVDVGSDDSTDPIESGSVSIAEQKVNAKLGANSVTYSGTAYHTASTSGGENSDGTPSDLSIPAGNTEVTGGTTITHTGVLPLYVNYVGVRKNETHDGSNVSGSWVQSAGTSVNGIGEGMQQVLYPYNVTQLVFSVLGQNGGTGNLVTIYYPSGTVKKLECYDSNSGTWKEKPEYKKDMDDNITITFDKTDYTYHGLIIYRTDGPSFSDYRVTFSKSQSLED